MTTLQINPARESLSSAQRAIRISLMLHAMVLVGLFVSGQLDRYRFEHHSHLQEIIEVSVAKPLGSFHSALSKAVSTGVGYSKSSASSGGLAQLLQKAGRKSFGAIRAQDQSNDLARTRTVLAHGPQGIPVADASATRGVRNALAQAMAQKGSVPSQYDWGGFENVSSTDGESSGTDISAITNALAKHQSEFRECYERALFVDSALSGRARFQIFISQSGSVDTSKVAVNLSHGTGAATSSLQSCLESVGNRVKFPKTIGQRSIEFGLLLRS